MSRNDEYYSFTVLLLLLLLTLLLLPYNSVLKIGLKNNDLSLNSHDILLVEIVYDWDYTYDGIIIRIYSVTYHSNVTYFNVTIFAFNASISIIYSNNTLQYSHGWIDFYEICNLSVYLIYNSNVYQAIFYNVSLTL